MSAKKRPTANTLSERNELQNVDIAQRAYQRWVARGRPLGDDQEDWFAAEAELRAEHTPAPAPRKSIRSALRRLGI